MYLIITTTLSITDTLKVIIIIMVNTVAHIIIATPTVAGWTPVVL